MYVCLCRAVTDRTVVETIEAGAVTISAIGRWCGAGRTCGGCRPELRRLLSETCGVRPDAVLPLDAAIDERHAC
ncbi:MAG TPA: (2Fe-2S)-binding protein [Acidimicrobiia bacterium]|nr:(2Fe-2S)-binding protein [Acidimicrobiia bacterium]